VQEAGEAGTYRNRLPVCILDENLRLHELQNRSPSSHRAAEVRRLRTTADWIVQGSGCGGGFKDGSARSTRQRTCAAWKGAGPGPCSHCGAARSGSCPFPAAASVSHSATDPSGQDRGSAEACRAGAARSGGAFPCSFCQPAKTFRAACGSCPGRGNACFQTGCHGSRQHRLAVSHSHTRPGILDRSAAQLRGH